ncbi:hypothetical protein TCAL_08584 [Tigriopus californicus]|uniref:Mitochondrial import inner membrane translocase subunit TIM50 n=1 Tax=Tigriopus californicus TaxID=6832 RepID=A0A553P1U7_TIGCA|nr:mitochondrial import inner membrane translocase subunit TIM50-like [Tigriopus californicus]TRY71658.1 hypothetical protein TCAL_08584 [Tigriopus californicus]
MSLSILFRAHGPTRAATCLMAQRSTRSVSTTGSWAAVALACPGPLHCGWTGSPLSGSSRGWLSRSHPAYQSLVLRGWADDTRGQSQGPSTRPSPSLADQVMAARSVAPPKSDQSESSPPPSGSNGDGPKPLSPWQKRGYIFLTVVLAGYAVGFIVYFATPEKDEDGNVIQDEFSSLSFPSQHYQRLKSRFFQTKKDLEEPFSDKLLPEPLPEPYHQPKYTVLIELTGLMVHSNWTHKHGWRFQKRPGVDMFLSQIGYPQFELVVYTTENAVTFYPIVDGLDPNNQFIMYRLFRDATRYLNGHHTKDLKALNRDLKRVILIDWDKDSVALSRDNTLLLPKWEGDNSDRSLIGLAQLLQAIKSSDVDDVREVLEYYRQFEDPIEAFRENQRKLQSEMQAEEERKKASENKRRSSFLSLSGFGRSRT